MKVYGIGLSPSLFALLFPFHLVLDTGLAVVQIGATLQRLLPSLIPGTRVEQHFRIARPVIPLTYAAIQAEQHVLFLLEAIDLPLRLRGQMVRSDAEDLLYFIGSPWITSTAELAPLGLTIQDFAIHDPMVDLLVLIQTQQSALADTQRLAAKLKEQRGILRKANAELAAQYQEQQRLHEELMQLQALTLAELSTPLIPLSDRVVVMPLIGLLDSKRMQQVAETLLQGILAQKAQIAILDITGVALIDTQVAQHIIQVAQAVRLLGAQVVVTGVRPEVAQALVGLGVDMAGIVTYSTLQRGIQSVLTQ